LNCKICLGDYKFVSATYRLFKLPKGSEKRSCLVMYNGEITGVEESFEFDAQFTFKVCSYIQFIRIELLIHQSS